MPVFDAKGIAHETTRDYGGEGMSAYIRPKCSCGWVGEAEYAYEDYQHTNVKEQEGRHIQSTKWWEN